MNCHVHYEFSVKKWREGKGVIFQFQEKVLLEVFCYYEHSLCLWNLNTISNTHINRPPNTIRDCLQISLILLCELKTMNIIKHNRSEIWRQSSRLKEEYLCIIFYVFRWWKCLPRMDRERNYRQWNGNNNIRNKQKKCLE